jgi:hypothetical protein
MVSLAPFFFLALFKEDWLEDFEVERRHRSGPTLWRQERLGGGRRGVGRRGGAGGCQMVRSGQTMWVLISVV